MTPTFVNLARSNRPQREMGLVMEEGFAFRFPTDYTYVEIPMWKAVNSEGETLEKATRNQAIDLVAACSVQPNYGAKMLAVVNPILYKYGMAPAMLMIDGQERRHVTVPITFRKDMNLTGLEWLVRIYLFN